MPDSSPTPSSSPPSLGGIMRGGRDALCRAGIALTQVVLGLGLDRLAVTGRSG